MGALNCALLLIRFMMVFLITSIFIAGFIIFTLITRDRNFAYFKRSTKQEKKFKKNNLNFDANINKSRGYVPFTYIKLRIFE